MTNINDRKTNLGHSPSSQPIPGVTGTNETNMREGTTHDQAAYRDGYVHGRNLEQERLEAGQEVRDNDNAARGLLLGIILTGLVGLTVGLTYFLSQRNQVPVQNPTIVVPRTSPSDSPSPQPPQIIERDRIVPVPVPQQPSPAPNVNITVPSAGQAPASAPSVQTAPPAQPAPVIQPAPAQPGVSQPGASQPGASSAPASGIAQPDSSGGTAAPTAPASGSAPGSSGTGSGQ